MARKVSEGKSIKVTVPPNSTVEAGNFVKLGGFLGMALQSVATGAGETKEVVLDVTPGLYETSQINSEDVFNAGVKIYWDNTNKVFTTNSANGANSFAGIVVEGEDTNGVIVFYFNPFLAML